MQKVIFLFVVIINSIMINGKSKQKVLAIMKAIDNLSNEEREFMIYVGNVAKEKGNQAAADLFL
jgi:hypothetical protein